MQDTYYYDTHHCHPPLLTHSLSFSRFPILFFTVYLPPSVSFFYIIFYLFTISLPPSLILFVFLSFFSLYPLFPFHSILPLFTFFTLTFFIPLISSQKCVKHSDFKTCLYTFYKTKRQLVILLLRR